MLSKHDSIKQDQLEMITLDFSFFQNFIPEPIPLHHVRIQSIS